MNCGLWDQLEALRWIRTEIHSFGGDPGNVTICGESAGAMSCGALFCSPLAQPFFRRAILMSGALSNVLRCSDARLIGDNFCKVLRVAADADALRTLSAKELLDGQWKLLFATDGAMQFQPCVDDELVLDVPLTMLDRQPELVRDKVILLGSNAHEWMLFSPFPSSLWNRRLSLDAAVKLAHRPLRRNAMNCVFEQDPLLEIRNLLKLIRAEQKLDWWGDVLKAFQTMLVFTAPAYLAAEACVPSVRNVYMYSFAFDAGMLGAPMAWNSRYSLGHTTSIGHCNACLGRTVIKSQLNLSPICSLIISDLLRIQGRHYPVGHHMKWGRSLLHT